MELWKAVILGIVEGLTEFLPVSSTGHLFLVGHWLRIDAGRAKEFADAFEIVIQLGAVLAVVVYYRTLLLERTRALIHGSKDARRLGLAIAIAFVPAATLGFFLHRRIDDALFRVGPIVGALIVGGVVMIAVDAVRHARGSKGADGLTEVTPRRATLIGLAQCFSLWPGTSRSMSTIVGGQLSGLSTSTATEFSFLLAIPTLGAATLFKLVKERHVIAAQASGALALAVGTVVSFVVAWIAIATFLRIVRRFGMWPFGVYRIVLGIVVVLVGRG